MRSPYSVGGVGTLTVLHELALVVGETTPEDGTPAVAGNRDGVGPDGLRQDVDEVAVQGREDHGDRADVNGAMLPSRGRSGYGVLALHVQLDLPNTR